jgi:hypothetical protein
MPLRPPLYKKQLQAIQYRHPGDEDVLALLWEVRRMRGTLHQIDECRLAIEKVWSQEVGGRLAAIHIMRTLLADEPGVREP